MVIFKLKKPNPINTMIPRADRISMERELNAEDGKTVKARELYSDSLYIKRRFMRLVNAYAYSNSARASRVELEAESYEEVDCPKERCYMYGRQELHSYDSTLFPYPYGVFFYSSHMVERRIPRKTIILIIGSDITTTETFTRLSHLEFRHRAGKHSTNYVSIRNFYMLL